MKHEPTQTALVVAPGESTPRVSSRTIAEVFGKNHKEVLRRINSLVAELPKSFSRRNFAPTFYAHSFNRQQTHYLLTRDAFSLLVMGFSGKEALLWKMRYIEAFNALERELISQRLLSSPEGLELVRQGLNLAKRLTPERLREIRKAVRYRKMGLSKMEIQRLLGCGKDKITNLLSEAAILKGGRYDN